MLPAWTTRTGRAHLWEMCSSVHRAAKTEGYIPQKLNLEGITWAGSIPRLSHVSFASSSEGMLLSGSPEKYVTYSLSLGNLNTWVRTSKVNVIDSFCVHE